MTLRSPRADGGAIRRAALDLLLAGLALYGLRLAARDARRARTDLHRLYATRTNGAAVIAARLMLQRERLRVVRILCVSVMFLMRAGGAGIAVRLLAGTALALDILAGLATVRARTDARAAERAQGRAGEADGDVVDFPENEAHR